MRWREKEGEERERKWVVIESSPHRRRAHTFYGCRNSEIEIEGDASSVGGWKGGSGIRGWLVGWLGYGSIRVVSVVALVVRRPSLSFAPFTIRLSTNVEPSPVVDTTFVRLHKSRSSHSLLVHTLPQFCISYSAECCLIHCRSRRGLVCLVGHGTALVGVFWF